MYKGAGARQELHFLSPACSTAEPRFAVFAVIKASHERPYFPETARELCFSQCSEKPKEAIQSLEGKYGFKLSTRILIYTLQYNEEEARVFVFVVR